MIIGIGIDVVCVKRMKHWVATPGLIERFFHPEELEAIHQRGQSPLILSLSARFAAKEAFGKALGTGLRGITLRDIVVINNIQGRPEMKLYGSALEKFNEIKAKHIFISLTHESDNAIAVAVIEG